jgi:voltage-gated potassium channel Kch
LLRHDGKFRCFLFRLNPLKDERGHITRWYGTATDIEDRKRAEEKIRKENVARREEIDKASMFEEIVGSSEALREVLSQVRKVAPTDSTVLITGETGTGKELIARAIHKTSPRSSHAFVSVNCAAIPQSLIASELFGHEKGAFTGALQRRLGRFELAEGGAYAMALTVISFSFVVSPVLINLGYKLVDRFTTETKPDLPLKTLSKSINDHVVVVGYSYVGRVICIMLERANIPYIAFERRLDRIAEAKKEKRKVYFGDVTSPGMMNALAISRARAVIVTTRDYSAAKQLISTVLHFHPNLKVMTAVPYLFQRDELREIGAAQVVALMPEGTLSFGKSVLGELGVGLDSIEPIMNSLRAADYASIRGVGGNVPDDAPKDTAAAFGRRD